MSLPTLEQLRKIVALTDDGHVVWRNTRAGHMRAGQLAGSEFEGYRRIKLYGHNVLAHRAAFALANDRWPVSDVDHINGNKTDNRPSNLREVTNRQNHQNRPSHRKGRLVGATFCKRLNRWQSQARLGKKKVFLGRHDSEEAAHAAYTKFLENNQLSPGEP